MWFKRRYRRYDDDWHLIDFQDVEVPDDFVDLEVILDGDAIRCDAPTVRVSFSLTDYTWKSGKVGVRSMGRCRVASLEVLKTPGQKRQTEGQPGVAKSSY